MPSGPFRADAPFTPLPLAEHAARRWLAPLFSVAILLACAVQFRGIDPYGLARMLPASPLFWLTFATYYLLAPATDWLIFRRLWRLPALGMLALIRKAVSNEILLGYSGELYFYAWARRNAVLVGAPFGAIKDVAILSAAVGNAATLALLGATWPLIGALHVGLSGRLLALSIGTIALSSLGALIFRRRLFSVPRAQLWFVAAMQLGRIVGMTVLAALLWHMVVPGAPLVWWLVLSTLRLLVSRLPFVPNKDVVFAGVAMFFVGRDAAVADVLAMMAGLILTTHVLVGASLSLAEFLGVEPGR